MDKFVSVNKQSKSARKAANSAQRKTWGALNPITRVPPNPKAYNRKKQPKFNIPY